MRRNFWVSGGLLLLLLLLLAVLTKLEWPIFAVAALGCITIALAALWGLSGSLSPSPGLSSEERPHRGINMSRISPAGFPGFVLAAGFVWMFWFGAPDLRAVVAAAAIVGCLAGVVLILIEKRRRVPSATPIGLAGHAPTRGDNGTPPASRQGP
jgi:hypothetical protein